MSLKDDLFTSHKLSPQFRRAVQRLDDAVDPDQPLFTAILQTSNDLPLTVDGAKVNNIAGGIKTARDVSLNGLKALVDNKSVSYIDYSSSLYPEFSKPL